jgi:hypothetical protein
MLYHWRDKLEVTARFLQQRQFKSAALSAVRAARKLWAAAKGRP